MFVAAIVIPVVIGQLKFKAFVMIFALIALSGLIVALAIPTRKLWELEKEGQ